jgi:hypothetical protein
MGIFSLWSARGAPTSTKHPAADFGRLLPLNVELEAIASHYCVWRDGSEPDQQLARRAALAICEKIEIHSQEMAAMEAELDLVLSYEKR